MTEHVLTFFVFVVIWKIRSRSYRNQSAGDDRELLERTRWLDRWMATKQWDNTITIPTTRDQVKTLEMDTNIATTTHHHRSYPATPPSCRATRTFGIRSASPRIPCSSPSPMVQPNYMSATESAKAKARTQSTPRRRPVITAKKRLCYAEEGSVRSPSLKSAYNVCLCGEHESDYSCCYGDGLAGKVSPCSTSDLRWIQWETFSFVYCVFVISTIVKFLLCLLFLVLQSELDDIDSNVLSLYLNRRFQSSLFNMYFKLLDIPFGVKGMQDVMEINPLHQYIDLYICWTRT